MRPTRLGALGYPLAGRARERPLVACWILVMVVFLLGPLAGVALVPVVGYLVTTLDASARGESAPQMGGDLRGLVGRGVAGCALALGLLLVPTLALLVTVYGALSGVPGSGPTGGEQLLLYGGSTAVLTLFLAALYLLPAALAGYATTGSLRRAVSPARLRPVAGHAAYFSRWMAGTVTLSTAGAFGNVALQINRAGPIVASLVVAYGAVLAAHLWGLGVRVARERRTTLRSLP